MRSHTRVLGDRNNRKYLDCLGKPLQVGDTVMWFVAQSSSIHWNIGVIDKIVDTDQPAYLGYEMFTMPGDSVRIESWDTAYTLRVKTLDKESPHEYVWTVPMERQGVVNGRRAFRKRTLEELKTNTIRAVERVVKVDVETDLR